jgi:hypothetical protein
VAALAAVSALTLVVWVGLRAPWSKPSDKRAQLVSVQPLPAEYQRLQKTVQEVATSYDAQKKYIEPEIEAAYDKGLQSLDRSIQEASASVSTDPEAREYLMNAYAQKAHVLTSALEFAHR